jgi:hypothetical protein
MIDLTAWLRIPMRGVVLLGGADVYFLTWSTSTVRGLAHVPSDVAKARRPAGQAMAQPVSALGCRPTFAALTRRYSTSTCMYICVQGARV